MESKKVQQDGEKSKSLKHWAGLAFIHLFLPLILILCGWDLGWWQGWLYSMIFVIAGIGPRIWLEKKRPELMQERGKMGKASNVKPWDKILAPLMAVSISFPLVIVAGLDHRYKWSSPFPTWLNIMGLVLVVMGYTFAGWAFIKNRFFSSVVRIQTERGHRVCDSGPYRIVRHPGYAANVLALPGIILALNSVWTILPVILALTITVIRTALEDRTLQDELPGYRDYTDRVRFRLVPGIY